MLIPQRERNLPVIKILLSFTIFTLIIAFGIKTIRQMTGKQRWALTKTLGCAIIYASLAFAAMFTLVILF